MNLEAAVQATITSWSCQTKLILSHLWPYPTWKSKTHYNIRNRWEKSNNDSIWSELTLPSFQRVRCKLFSCKRHFSLWQEIQPPELFWPLAGCISLFLIPSPFPLSPKCMLCCIDLITTKKVSCIVTDCMELLAECCLFSTLHRGQEVYRYTCVVFCEGESMCQKTMQIFIHVRMNTFRWEHSWRRRNVKEGLGVTTVQIPKEHSQSKMCRERKNILLPKLIYFGRKKVSPSQKSYTLSSTIFRCRCGGVSSVCVFTLRNT